MNIRSEKIEDVAVVTVQEGVIDARNAAAFKDQMKPVVQDQTKILLDLAQVTFVDSAGLGALLSTLRTVTSAGGDMKLCSLSKPVRATFQLVRMHRVFQILNDRDEALRSFKS